MYRILFNGVPIGYQFEHIFFYLSKGDDDLKGRWKTETERDFMSEYATEHSLKCISYYQLYNLLEL